MFSNSEEWSTLLFFMHIVQVSYSWKALKSTVASPRRLCCWNAVGVSRSFCSWLETQWETINIDQNHFTTAPDLNSRFASCPQTRCSIIRSEEGVFTMNVFSVKKVCFTGGPSPFWSPFSRTMAWTSVAMQSRAFVTSHSSVFGLPSRIESEFLSPLHQDRVDFN